MVIGQFGLIPFRRGAVGVGALRAPTGSAEEEQGRQWRGAGTEAIADSPGHGLAGVLPAQGRLPRHVVWIWSYPGSCSE